MDGQLEILVHLQQADIKIHHLQDAIAALPAQLQSIEQELQRKQQLADQADKAVPAEEARRRRLDSDRKDQQQKLVKYREQSNSVKTNEQFHALQHEIGFVEAEIRRIEDEELTSMINSEGLESQRSEARKAVAEQAKEVEQEKTRVRALTEERQKELAVFQKERAQLRKEVDEPLLAQYDRIAHSSRKTAMARASGQRCLACQMALRPQFWNQVRQGGLLNCESCGRMLYFDSREEPVTSTPV
jgi:uncharacterized protein